MRWWCKQRALRFTRAICHRPCSHSHVACGLPPPTSPTAVGLIWRLFGPAAQCDAMPSEFLWFCLAVAAASQDTPLATRRLAALETQG
jgi:hypothetical protein